MRFFWATLQAEMLKVRRSKVIWITAAAFALAPMMAAFFMFVLKNPELAESSGLLGAQAQIAGEASWPSYLGLLAQMVAVGGIFVFGLVTSWIFGREYADGTAKDLLALPFSRAIIVIAKFVAAFATSIAMSIYVVILGMALGWLVDLPKWSILGFVQGLSVLCVATFLTILLVTPVAFLASLGRGYLAPLGFIIITLVFSQIVAAVGYGRFFPWSIPAFYSGIAGKVMMGWGSLVIVLLTSLVGFLGTLCFWLFADQH